MVFICMLMHRYFYNFVDEFWLFRAIWMIQNKRFEETRKLKEFDNNRIIHLIHSFTVSIFVWSVSSVDCAEEMFFNKILCSTSYHTLLEHWFQTRWTHPHSMIIWLFPFIGLFLCGGCARHLCAQHWYKSRYERIIEKNETSPKTDSKW